MTPETLFRNHHLPVFRYLKRMTGSREIAEELTQDVFVRVVRGLPSYRSQGKDAAWVFSIARNVLLNRHRDAGRRPEPATNPADESLPGHDLQPIRRIELDEALAALPALDRETFLLRELGGLGYDDIARLCATSPNAVRSRIHRARLALRSSLAVGPRRVRDLRNRS